MGKQRRERFDSKLDDLIHLWQGLGGLKAIQNRPRKKRLISGVRDTGVLHTDRSGIAEVFAIFYESLYEARLLINLKAQSPTCQISRALFLKKRIIINQKYFKNIHIYPLPM